MYLAIVLTAWLASAAIFGLFGAWIATQRDRPGGEGFILGAIFGPLGVIVEVLLPQGVKRPPAAPLPRAPTRAAKPTRVGKPLKPIDDDQLL